MKISVEILNVGSGETRVFEDELPDDYPESAILYMWENGSYGCDCNRYLFFERAGGGDPDISDAVILCGHGKYEVAVKMPDGEYLYDEIGESPGFVEA